MRKKIICIVAALSMLLLVPLTGCGAKDNTEDIKATVDGFMTSMQAGDIEGMKSYCDPALFEEGGTLASFNELQSLETEFASSVGMSEDELSDKTKETIHNYVNEVLTKMIKSYEIGEITEEEENKAKVNVDVTFGFDPDKMDDVDIDGMAETMAQDYMEKNMQELTKIYQEQGQTALMNKVLDDLAPDLLGAYVDEIMKTGEVNRSSVLTVENKDGKWLITGEE